MCMCVYRCIYVKKKRKGTKKGERGKTAHAGVYIYIYIYIYIYR